MSKRHEEFAKKQGYQCAYTGKRLEEKFQLDHVWPTCRGGYDRAYNIKACLTIVNHYKRAQTLEEFREYMLTFHLRLAKLPKKTKSIKTKKRIEYMHKIAWAFDIKVDKPFNGRFHFEKFGYPFTENHAIISIKYELDNNLQVRFKKLTNNMRKHYWDPTWQNVKTSVISQFKLNYENS